MIKSSPIRPRHGERGEGNTKFVITVMVFAIIGFMVYNFVPTYYKVEQLRHDIREKTRIGAINGYDVKRMEVDCQKIIDDINFPQKINLKVTKKGDNLMVVCSGVIPVKLIVYTYNYNVDVNESYSRYGY